ELADIQSSDSKAFCNIEFDENNLLHWTIVLVPDKEPYNKGAFKVSVDFPVEYPFKPPKITFLQVCLPIIAPDNWKPATKTEQGITMRLKFIVFHRVIPNTLDHTLDFAMFKLIENARGLMNKFFAVMNALLGLIVEPEPDHPLRADLAEEFTKDRKKFNKNAEDYTKKYGVKRPDGY
ncbi:unnamed protein product, partial [Anisakis simplex]|uniref:Ubiquitin/ISG15-conjugating enzyme E2 L6 (inferred by orthology to a human protein) n=1 Tax=Anisakis simplex TaxID=6269 RepID=A0A0M3KJS3_ANISI